MGKRPDLEGKAVVARMALGCPLPQLGAVQQVHQPGLPGHAGGRVELNPPQGLQLSLKPRQQLPVRLALHRVSGGHTAIRRVSFLLSGHR